MFRTSTILGLTATLALTACSGSGTSPQGTNQQNLKSNVLQLAVGTANIYGDLGSAHYVGINVATTYRQAKTSLAPGDSAVAVSAPTLSGPFVLNAPAGSGGSGAPGPDPLSTIATGPAPSDEGTSHMSATAQTGGSITTFGTSGGGFGLGLEPFNFNSTSGTPYTYQPYVVPAFDPAGDPNAFIPWGYPPAFPSTAGGPGNAGFSEGLDVFANVTPVAGSYSLSLLVPVSPAYTQSASATLSSTALLPAFVQQLPGLDSNNDGGATFPIALPAGVTEAYVQVTDIGPGGTSVSCNGSDKAQTGYTLFVNATGTATLAATLGAGGTPSICTVSLNTAANGGVATPGDQFVVQLIGFDYPWFEASYPNSNGNPSPAISGTNGQADVTISSAIVYQQVAGSVLKSFHAKHSLTRFKRR